MLLYHYNITFMVFLMTEFYIGYNARTFEKPEYFLNFAAFFFVCLSDMIQIYWLFPSFAILHIINKKKQKLEEVEAISVSTCTMGKLGLGTISCLYLRLSIVFVFYWQSDIFLIAFHISAILWLRGVGSPDLFDQIASEITRPRCIRTSSI